MADLLKLAREIAALAQAGLAYTRDAYDRERFLRLREIAGELLRSEAAVPPFAWPVEPGYPTPKVDVRAVVFHEEQVLLVKERSSGLWTVPGGWADVNLSPAQNAEKECLEESGYRVRARVITSVKDRDLAGYPPHPFAIYKIYFLCDFLGGEAASSVETHEASFFPLNALPPLDPHRNCETEIRHAFRIWKGEVPSADFN